MNRRRWAAAAALVVIAIAMGTATRHWAASGPVQMVRVTQLKRAAIVPALYRSGLRVALPAWTAVSYTGSEPHVLSPSPGRLTPKGTVVTLEMDPTSFASFLGGQSGTYLVPEVVGEDFRVARKKIVGAGLSWAVRAAALPPTTTPNLYTSYCIASQRPVDGAIVTLPKPGHEDYFVVNLTAQPC